MTLEEPKFGLGFDARLPRKRADGRDVSMSEEELGWYGGPDYGVCDLVAPYRQIEGTRNGPGSDRYRVIELVQYGVPRTNDQPGIAEVLLPLAGGHLAGPTFHDHGVGDDEKGAMPTLDRVYQNHHLDSKRWASFVHRPGDIVISTSYKAGTTWMQRIVSLLIFGPDPLLSDLRTLSPWIDARWSGPEEVTNQTLAGQTHRRFVKSHLPLDAIPYWDDVRYIAVGRDSRDVFMSIFNHWSAYTDYMYQLLAAGDPVGGPMPRCPADPRVAWAQWITTGSFSWEDDGSPWWSHHYHVNSFWQYRHLPNILLVHYADMKADLDGEMRRIARFLGIDIDEWNWPNLVQRATFESMKQEAQARSANLAVVFDGGSDRFYFKGTNGRWRDVLTPEDLGLYETAVARLEPDLQTWLEGGRLANPNSVPSPASRV